MVALYSSSVRRFVLSHYVWLASRVDVWTMCILEGFHRIVIPSHPDKQTSWSKAVVVFSGSLAYYYQKSTGFPGSRFYFPGACA